MPRSALIGWLAATALLPGPLSAQDVDLEWVDRALLDSGEVLLDFGDAQHFEGQIRAAVRVVAAAEFIWTILRDCESAPEYVPKVLACELLETLETDNAQIFRQRVKLTWFLPSLVHDFRLDFEPFSRIGVSRVSGPFEVLDGTWWLVPDDGPGTILVYSLNFDPGMPIPRFVVGRILQRDVPIILAAVRDRAQALQTADSSL